MHDTKQTIQADRELSLIGEVCPYTFVKSKLAIEEMLPGEVLRIIVDYVPATNNVPRSMENEGNEVVKVGQLNDSEWEIVIRKGSQTSGPNNALAQDTMNKHHEC